MSGPEWVKNTVAPHEDCPRCPSCGMRCGTPTAKADWNHRANMGDRIVCPACGTGWVGTDAEVAQAEAAWIAWVAYQLAESQAASEASR